LFPTLVSRCVALHSHVLAMRTVLFAPAVESTFVETGLFSLADQVVHQDEAFSGWHGVAKAGAASETQLSARYFR